MATFSLLPILPLFLLLLHLSTAAPPSPATDFIKSSCKATTYPALCVQSLTVYASTIQRSRRQLAQTALSVSLAKAQSAKAFVAQLAKTKGLKPREYAALKDCIEEMGDTADRLSKSVRELKNTGRASGPDFIWHMSNVETWVSAALTDDNTCLDGFSGRVLNGKIKDSVRGRVTNLVQVTSNALALVNSLAEKH
ncbi:hypothetical protein LguiA_034659 [Lonicera macranthoides]